MTSAEGDRQPSLSVGHNHAMRALCTNGEHSSVFVMTYVDHNVWLPGRGVEWEMSYQVAA